MKINKKFNHFFQLYFFVVPTLLVFSIQTFALRVVNEELLLDKLEDYEFCQKRDYSGAFCHDALLRWVDKNKTDAFVAGKMTRKIMNSSAAIPFFSIAFENNLGNCKDEDVKLAVTSALDLPADNNALIVNQAKKIGINYCFENLKEEFSKAGIGTNYFNNICVELSSKGLLSGIKKKKCTEVNK